MIICRIIFGIGMGFITPIALALGMYYFHGKDNAVFKALASR
jgi:MFS family permease